MQPTLRFKPFVATSFRDVDWESVDRWRRRSRLLFTLLWLLGALLIVAIVAGIAIWLILYLAPKVLLFGIIPGIFALLVLAYNILPGVIRPVVRFVAERTGYLNAVVRRRRSPEGDRTTLNSGSVFTIRSSRAGSDFGILGEFTSWALTLAVVIAGIVALAQLAGFFYDAIITGQAQGVLEPTNTSTISDPRSVTAFSAVVTAIQWFSSTIAGRSILIASSVSALAAVISLVPRWAFRFHRGRPVIKRGEAPVQQLGTLNEIKLKDDWSGLVKYKDDKSFAGTWYSLTEVVPFWIIPFSLRRWAHYTGRRLYIAIVAVIVIMLSVVAWVFFDFVNSIDSGMDAARGKVESAQSGSTGDEQVNYLTILFRLNAIQSDLVTARWAGGVAFTACVIAVLSASLLWARRDRSDALFNDDGVIRRGLLLQFSYDGEAWYAYLTAWQKFYRKLFVVPVDQVSKIG